MTIEQWADMGIPEKWCPADECRTFPSFSPHGGDDPFHMDTLMYIQRQECLPSFSLALFFSRKGKTWTPQDFLQCLPRPYFPLAHGVKAISDPGFYMGEMIPKVIPERESGTKHQQAADTVSVSSFAWCVMEGPYPWFSYAVAFERACCFQTGALQGPASPPCFHCWFLLPLHPLSLNLLTVSSSLPGKLWDCLLSWLPTTGMPQILSFIGPFPPPSACSSCYLSFSSYNHEHQY